MSTPGPPDGSLPLEVQRHYEVAAEARRLSGGAGVHALWLAAKGYEVHLIDAHPPHVSQALEASRAQPACPLASASVGDARRLDHEDGSAGAVLLLGPLYHLTQRSERVAALAEVRRVVRESGRVIAAGISRWASTLDGLARGFMDDPAFVEIARRDRLDGQHRNPTDQPLYFTTAYFHRPEELREEMEAAGLRHETTLAVEGPAWLLQDLERQWENPGLRRRLLEAVGALEAEPSVLGASAHLLAVGRKR